MSVLEVIRVRKERKVDFIFPLSHLEGVLFHKATRGSGPKGVSSD